MMSLSSDTQKKSSSIQLRGVFDSAYFLMFPGWETELRSNRWHFATRLARLLPVILVQPVLNNDELIEQEEPESRIPNTTILRVNACPVVPGPPEVHRTDSLMASVQILKHMMHRGHKRPLLWLYNPWLALPFAWLPSPFRFMHASEDWQRFPLPDDDFHRYFKSLAVKALQAADLVVAVSSGVAQAASLAARDARLITISNGCDFAAYSNAKPDVELSSLSATCERIGIFAGNIGRYFDFKLMEKAARQNPRTLFCIFGREPKTGDHGTGWDELRSHANVRFFGEAAPERIPQLYAAAHFGFIPYVSLEHLKKSGFALKLLEMAAAGLPVVSTDMEPIRGLASAIHVAADEAEFLDFLTRADKRRLSDAESSELVSLAQASDYDIKFDQVLSAIADAMQPHPAGSGRAEREGAEEDCWMSAALQSVAAQLNDADLIGNEKAPAFAEDYLARGGAATPDGICAAFLVLRTLEKRLTASRTEEINRRHDQEMNQLKMLELELVKADLRIQKLKANEERNQHKSFKVRLTRFFRTLIGGRPEKPGIKDQS